MKRLAGVLVLVLLMAACGQAAEELKDPDNYEDPDTYKALIAATPVAQVEGEAVSPDGRFEVRAEGASGLCASGVQPPEFLQIIDRETGEVLWQDRGWLWQSALWSEDSGMVALAWSARTWSAIVVIETENWTGWDFTLPDGSSIPEYTFLPHGEPWDGPWGEWRSENSLELTIGRGGDGGEQRFYRCLVVFIQNNFCFCISAFTYCLGENRISCSFAGNCQQLVVFNLVPTKCCLRAGVFVVCFWCHINQLLTRINDTGCYMVNFFNIAVKNIAGYQFICLSAV